MITPMNIDTVLELVKSKYKEIEFSNTESKYINYIEHLDGMSVALKESKLLGATVVHLNQAEVTTLTKAYTQ